MKQTIILIVILFLFGTAFADTPIGLTLRMKGDISLSRNEQTNPLAEGASIYNDDTLRSREDSFAFIKFVDDGATLRLFENSILTINTEKEDNKLTKKHYLEVGNVFTSVRKNTGDLIIETPTTVASVKGTNGFVVVNEDGTTIVIVITGSYSVFNKQSQLTIIVTAGNSCTSDGTGSLESYPTIEIDQEWLDAIIDDSMDGSDIYRIELIREGDDAKKTIEIEFE